MDICIDSTEKLTKHIRLTMETDVVSSENNETLNEEQSKNVPQSPRSPLLIGVSRQELLEKVDQLKKRWNIALQSA